LRPHNWCAFQVGPGTNEGVASGRRTHLGGARAQVCQAAHQVHTVLGLKVGQQAEGVLVQGLHPYVWRRPVQAADPPQRAHQVLESGTGWQGMRATRPASATRASRAREGVGVGLSADDNGTVARRKAGILARGTDSALQTDLRQAARGRLAPTARSYEVPEDRTITRARGRHTTHPQHTAHCEARANMCPTACWPDIGNTHTHSRGRQAGAHGLWLACTTRQRSHKWVGSPECHSKAAGREVRSALRLRLKAKDGPNKHT